MRRRVFVITASIATVAAGGVAITKIPIKEVVCSSQYGPCSESINEALGGTLGESVLSSRRRIDRLLSDNRLVSEYSIRYKLPGTLEVHTIERKADVAFVFEGESVFTLISGEGDIIGQTEATELPKVLIQDRSTTKEEIVFAGQILISLYKSHNLRLGKIANNSFIVNLEDQPEMVFPLSGDIDVLLGSTSLTLSWLNSGQGETRIEGDVERIDFRYKNPVVQ